MICAPAVVVEGRELVDRALVVVELPNMNPPPAAVPVAVPVAPMVPVHEAPVGQQATWLAASAEQMAVTLQQTPAWPRLLQEL